MEHTGGQPHWTAKEEQAVREVHTAATQDGQDELWLNQEVNISEGIL